MSLVDRVARVPWRQIGGSLLLVGLFGAARMPIEQRNEELLREAGFREWSPNIATRDQLGQAGFAGALGGFRSLVALFYDVKAHVAREEKEWAEVEKFRNVTTTLQPRYWAHWDIAAWDMAWNAFAYYRGVAERHKEEFLGWETENVIMPRYLEKGIDFAMRGYAWLPDSYRMPRIVGDIHSQKCEDKCAAIDWYLEASQKPDAWPFLYRSYVHHMAICPGREDEAYPLTKELYWGGQRTPTVRHDLEDLEDRYVRLAAQGKTREQLEAAVAAPGADYRTTAALAMFLAEGGGTKEEAAAAYQALAQAPDVPVFYKKKWAFALAEIPASAPAAYRALRKLYNDDPDALLRRDEVRLVELEKQLGISGEESLTGG
jgi:hypothetical protein